MIAVTGATGELGGRVARRLASRGAAVRLVVRDAARAPSIDGAEVALSPGYHDRAAMTAALEGADALLLVSGRESATRVDEHRSAVAAAADAGVGHVVYTSFLGAADDATFTLARHHAATERAIDEAGLRRTFLRNAMYLDFVPFFASGDDGAIRGPAGDGHCAWVARDDVADVAVEALLDPAAHAGRTYDVTGPQARTLADAAAVLTRVTGREVRYVDETEEEAYASRARFGAPAFEVEGWVSSYLAVRDGSMDVVSDVVPTLCGRPATSLEELLERNPGTWAHLRP